MADFKKIVDECQAECRFARGEWCVPVFKGVEGRKGTVEETQSVETRTSRIHSATHLQRMQDSSRALHSSFMASLVDVVRTPDIMQAPETEAQPSDQLAQAVAAFPISSAIQREVIPHTFPSSDGLVD